MIRRKKIEEDDDNPERWLLSYADFITLLFAFFVVMYAISSVNLSKYKELSASVGQAFTGDEAKSSSAIQKNPTQVLKNEQETSVIKPLPLSYLYQEKYRREREKMEKMGKELSDQLQPLVDQQLIKVSQTQRGIEIDIQDKVLFDLGDATLNTQAKRVLDEIIKSAKQHQRLIQIEGHTDSAPIHTSLFDSNWELSALRATTVLKMFINGGIAPQRLSAIAMADTRPVSSSDTELGKAQNRRVSIWILYDMISDTPT